MLTTVHTGNLIESGKIDFRTKQAKLKPNCIVDYNKNMKLVDKADMQISSMKCMRKSMKWYKKLFSFGQYCYAKLLQHVCKKLEKKFFEEVQQGGSKAITQNLWKLIIKQKG